MQFIPIIIDDYSVARYATEIEAKNILGRMRKSTNEIKEMPPIEIAGNN